MAVGVARTHGVGLISKVRYVQDWTFGQTGNWLEFKVDSDGDTNLDLDQDRVHNKANEIHHTTYGSAITESTGPSWIDPKHAAAKFCGSSGNCVGTGNPARGEAALECGSEAAALPLRELAPAFLFCYFAGASGPRRHPASLKLRRDKEPSRGQSESELSHSKAARRRGVKTPKLAGRAKNRTRINSIAKHLNTAGLDAIALAELPKLLDRAGVGW